MVDGDWIVVDSDRFLDMPGAWRNRSWFPETPRLIPLFRWLRRHRLGRLAELLR